MGELRSGNQQDPFHQNINPLSPFGMIQRFMARPCVFHASLQTPAAGSNPIKINSLISEPQRCCSSIYGRPLLAKNRDRNGCQRVAVREPLLCFDFIYCSPHPLDSDSHLLSDFKTYVLKRLTLQEGLSLFKH